MNGSEASLARAIRGPITLITVGVLFALNNFTGYSFGETWPVLLIVFGLLSLLRRGTAAPPPPLAPPTWVPQAGTYRESQYPQTAPPAVSPATPPAAPAREADESGGQV